MADGSSAPGRPVSPASAAAIRRRMERAIEAAIAVLDALDGDPDLEPSLAKFNVARFPGAAPDDQDLEEEHDGCEPDDDLEHTLGWSEGAGWQFGSRTRAGSLGYGADDGEAECEDEGAQCEDEGNDSGDREPDDFGLCNWPDEGDQSELRALAITPSRRPATARPPHANVAPFHPVKML